MESKMTWRRCSSTCTAAPMQIVSMKATMRTGTARRSNGSAVRSRRYAGLAMDCASPLIESDRKDALAVSARAMPASASDDPLDPVRRCVPHRPRISPFESTRIDLSRVGSQYFFNFCPTLFSRRRSSKKIMRPESLARRCCARLREKFVDAEPLQCGCSAVGERAGDDVVNVARQIGRRSDPPQRRLRALPPPRLERAPGAECAHEASRDLRVLRIELEHDVG